MKNKDKDNKSYCCHCLHYELGESAVVYISLIAVDTIVPPMTPVVQMVPNHVTP